MSSLGSPGLEDLYRNRFEFVSEDEFLRVWKRLTEIARLEADSLDPEQKVAQIIPSPSGGLDSLEATELLEFLREETPDELMPPEDCSFASLAEWILRNPVSKEELERRSRVFYWWVLLFVSALVVAVWFVWFR